MKRFSLLLILPILLTGCAEQVNTPQANKSAVIYFVADTPRGFKLFSEKREFPQSKDFATSVISDLVSGELSPLDPDYVNLWGAKNSLKSITASGTVATIDLAAISLNVGAESEERAIDQLVWTYLGMSPTMTAVRFTVNGQSVESFAGHVDTTEKFSRAPSYEVLNPIQISSILEGGSLTNPITISGQACTFEANVFWRISQAGKVLNEGSTTAEIACPDRSAWSVALETLAPGAYKIEAIEYSAEDGSLFAIDDKNFVVK